MEKFITELQSKYDIDDITGHLGSILEQVAGNVDTNDYKFLNDLYNMAVEE